MMQELLEKILEQLHTGEWGFIDPFGRKVAVDENHAVYATKYLRDHKKSVPKSEQGMIAKFMGLAKCVRYYIENTETGFSIVAPVSPVQLDVMRQMSKKQEVIFDILDKEGDSLSYGGGLNKLVYHLKSMDLLEKILDESSIDFPQLDLDTSVWDKKNSIYILKPGVKKRILDVISKFPDVPLLEITKEIRIVGSLCTNQFLSESDLDIHIVPDMKKLRKYLK